MDLAPIQSQGAADAWCADCLVQRELPDKPRELFK